jgi:hypothetical protein
VVATFGDFLDAAGAHIDGACQQGELPGGAAAGVARELDRVAAALVRYLADVHVPGGAESAAAPDAAARAGAARHA